MTARYLNIESRFAGSCAHCTAAIAAGERVVFDTKTRQIYDIDCAKHLKFDVVDSRVRTVLGKNAPNLDTANALGLTVPARPPEGGNELQRRVDKLRSAMEITFREISSGHSAHGSQIADLRSELKRVESELRSEIDSVRRATTQRIVIERTDAAVPPLDLGLQHERFALLLMCAQARGVDGNRLNLWLAGPAGSGKTTAAKNVARALDVPFFTNGALDQKYELKGFIDAQGRIVSTQFREAWTTPSVYLFDEVDGSQNSAILPFNAALANGLADFPGSGLTPRHPDCLVMAAGNTWGLGGTAQYVGRLRLDAAFLDRFIQLDWPVDETLETLTCPDEGWVSYVQKVRKRVRDRGLQHMITPEPVTLVQPSYPLAFHGIR